MSWLDFIFVLTLAAITAFAAHRRMLGLTVGLGGVILFRPLIALATLGPVPMLFIGLLVGLLLAFVGRLLSQRVPIRRMWSSLLGALGGFLLGVVMILALVTSLPVERDFDERIIYPPRNILFSTAVRRSAFVTLGRDILLYPLLTEEGNTSPQQRILAGLHAFFVARRPWEGG